MKTRKVGPSPALVAAPGVLAFLLTGCPDPGPPPEMEAELTELREERETLSAELDQARGEIDQLRDAVAGIELPDPFLDRIEEPPTTTVDSLRALERYAEESAQLHQEAESRAAIFQQRVDSLQAVHEETVSDHEERLAEEEERIGDLEEERAALESARAELEEQLASARETMEALEGELGRAWYVVGTRDELVDRGVVREEGGARFLGFLWKRGETLVPAREADRANFSPLDLREDRTIPLPDPEASYRIVSRHDPADLGPDVDEGGRVQAESLEIVGLEGFLDTSRFLIVLQE